MKRILQPGRVLRASLFVLLLSVVGMTKANPVDMRTAREVGMKFMNTNTNTPLRSIDDLQLVTTYNINRGDAAFYVFNTPNGFVIVSADDCATPILGYSNEGQFDIENIPIQLQYYLQGFVEQIQYGIENHIEADEQIVQQWEKVKSTGQLGDDRSNHAVEPLITATWNQGCYYNAKCPEDENGPCDHCVTGCVATAMAQLMHYWGYPEHGTGFHSYTPNGYPEQSVDFGATTYDWANMLNTLYYPNNPSSEQIDAVATLMWHCGVSVNMSYGPSESGTYISFVREALIDYFNYSDEMSKESYNDYTAVTWKARLKDCLDLGRPLCYSGYSSSGIGHAFVCDGYDNNDLFHFNLGWGGNCNGYYAINAILNYNSSISAIFNIHPQGETTSYVINVSSNNEEYGTVSGGGAFVHGTYVTLSATANSGYCFCYWEENGEIVSTDPNYSFTANYNRNFVAVFTEPFNITVSAMEGGMVSGGGTFNYGELCTVSAMSDEWFIFGCWTENGNVVSYDSNYSFVVTSDRVLIAHFASREGNIIFNDDKVRVICVSNWDTNSDGALSYDEAAAVEYIGTVFSGNTEIIFFDELWCFNNLVSIDNEAFSGCINLNGLSLPNSIISIGSYAFYGCINLTNLTIPYSVNFIGEYAFYDCNSLNRITIPNSVDSISNYAFYGCSSLSIITIPNSVVSIGDCAFYGCSRLRVIAFPNSVVSIGDYAFYGCSSLTSLTLPKFITSIGNSAFKDCIGLAGPLIIPEFVSSIGNEVFWNCPNLTSLIVFAVIPPTIGYWAFFNTSINNGPVYVPCESVDAYQSAEGWDDFLSITGMCSPGTITIAADPPEKGEVTGAGTYESGSFCTVIATPNEGYGFAYWTENGDMVSNDAVYSFVVTGERQLTAHFVLLEGNIVFADPFVEEICLMYWDTNDDWKLSYDEAAAVTNLYRVFSYNMFITSFDELQYFTGLTSLEETEFLYCQYLTSITLPNSVTSIGNNAFDYCESLQSIFIPQSVTSFGWNVFNGCNGLQQIIVHPNNTVFDSRNECNAIIETSTNTLKIGCKNTVIPNSVTSIGDYAFNGCRGLCGSLTIPNSVTSIGNYAFSGCNDLTSVYYSGDIAQWCSISFGGEGSNPVSYAHNLYLNDTLLTELVIPETVISINQYAFDNATCLTGSLTIPNSVTSIGNHAFYGCSGLTGSLTIPNSVTSIGSYAFYGCSGLTGSLTIPNSVTSIGNWAFQYCSGLTGLLAIPNSVTSIGFCAFYNCSGLTGSLTIPNSVTSIGYYAFYNCCGLSSLIIGNSVTSISNYAFYGCSGLTSITIHAEMPPVTYSSTFNYCPKSIPVYVPCGGLEAYQSAAYWNAFTNIQESCSEQIVTLSEGWNWFSTYLEITLDDLKNALVEALPGTTITIKSRNNGYATYNGSMWRGVLSSLDVTQMYMIQAGTACEITLQGIPINPVEHPVTIRPGVNWIAFPLSESMTIANAFAGFAVANDAIKSKSNGYTTFNGTMWRGTLNTLQPGAGYIYQSNATEDRTFTFPTSAK